MIKRYKQYIKESLLDHLKGPTDEEVFNSVINYYKDDYDGMIKKFSTIGFKKGIDYILNLGVDLKHDSYILALSMCVKNNDIELFKYLLERNIKINEKEEELLLHKAFDSGFVNMCIFLKNDLGYEITNINIIRNILEKLIEEENLELIKLLEKEIKHLGIYLTPYYVSLSAKNIEIFKYLFKFLEDPYYANSFILRKHGENGDYDITKFLLENGFDVNVMDGYLLENAALKLSINMVKLLMDYGIKNKHYKRLINALNDRLYLYERTNQTTKLKLTKKIIKMLKEYHNEKG